MVENMHPRTIPPLDMKRVETLIDLALSEDLGADGDITTTSVIPLETECTAYLICKEKDMVLAGMPVAERVFFKIDPMVRFVPLKKEGVSCSMGERIAVISGKAQSILTAERTALNFLQRLCGVATAAHRYAMELVGTKCAVLDTRKTTPGFRNLEKYAVAVGGAVNHRIGLFDQIMIKDNHRELANLGGPDGIAIAVGHARGKHPGIPVEVEADRIEEVVAALAAGADCIMLDNMSDEQMAEAMKIINGKALVEASGGITINRLRAIGRLGVDYVSVGALTHSVKSADISLDIEVRK